jgi:cytosine/adenosine deaminase-related metal-dependent hydrolase
VELHERLATGRRGSFGAPALLRAATVDGHASLGWPEAGRLEAGALGDLVCVGLDSVRLAGAQDATLLESVVFAATAADVRDVVVGGRQVVTGGRHLGLGDVAAALRTSIAAVLP